ncbi:coiled-coil domain-containing protein, partial [Brachionus plicatilis]
MNEIEKKKQELYKWNKPDKHSTKLNSKIKESDNIQLIHQWLRKIEDVSEAAINQTLNTKSPCENQTKNLKSTISLNIGDKKKSVQIKHDPYCDAHDLINEWMTDKIRLDLDDDFYDYVNITEVNKFSNNEKFLGEIRAELLDKDYSSLDIKGIDYDKYDENYIAKDILNNLMKKNLVDPKKLIYMDNHKPKTKDFRMQIEMRHQAVKENREKRAKDLENKRKENLKRKEIEFEARQMVQKEENEKKMRENLDKQLIEQEAQKIRAEINEKRKKDEEKRKEILEKIREQEKQELLYLKKNIENDASENLIELKRKEIAEKRANDLADSLIKTRQLRLQQKAFSTWYGMILDLRLKSGKAKAVSDWKASY